MPVARSLTRPVPRPLVDFPGRGEGQDHRSLGPLLGTVSALQPERAVVRWTVQLPPSSPLGCSGPCSKIGLKPLLPCLPLRRVWPGELLQTRESGFPLKQESLTGSLAVVSRPPASVYADACAMRGPGLCGASSLDGSRQQGSCRPSSDWCLIAPICAFTRSLERERSRQLPRQRSEPQAREGGVWGPVPPVRSPWAVEATETWQRGPCSWVLTGPGARRGIHGGVWESEKIPGWSGGTE